MKSVAGEVTSTNDILKTLSETFSNTQNICFLWPELVSRHPEILDQATSRSEQILAVETVMNILPAGTPIEDAVDAGTLTSVETVHFFNKLSEVIDDPDYERLILYLPFEILPTAEWLSHDHELNMSIYNFRRIYVQAWHSLLKTRDVRANFIDGDVPEVQLRDGDLLRVVKAVHLIPALIKKGWLTIDDIYFLLEHSSDTQLQSDLQEVVAGLHKVETTFDEMNIVDHFNLSKIMKKIEEAFSNNDDEFSDDLPLKRKQWLIEQKKQKFIENTAMNLSRAIISFKVDLKELKNALINRSEFHFELYIETLRQASLMLVSSQPQQCKEFISSFLPELINLLPNLSTHLQQKCSVLFRHLYTLQLIPEETMTQLDIDYTDFNSTISLHECLAEYEIEKIQMLLEQMKNDNLLQHCIEPIVLIGGSKVKGYGEKNSDLDIALFVKASVHYNERKTLQLKLRGLFAEQALEEPLIVWLDETVSGLSVHDFNDDDAHTAKPNWTHTLLNTFWIGDITRIREIQQQLIPLYFYAHQAKPQERREYLERLEQDSLQYRLMHTGYNRFQPPQNPLDQQLYLPDSKSSFWDSGYRQVATRLFLKNVFLPKIK